MSQELSNRDIDRIAASMLKQIENKETGYVTRSTINGNFHLLGKAVDNKVDREEIADYGFGVKRYKDAVDTVEDLPKNDNQEGDGRVVSDDLDPTGKYAYVHLWDGTKWGKTPLIILSSDVAISGGSSKTLQRVDDSATITNIDLTDSLIQGQYIHTYEGVGIDLTQYIDNPIDDIGFCCIILECNPYDTFVLKGLGGMGGRLWTFVDSNNISIANSGDNAGSILEQMKVVTPDAAHKVIINMRVNQLNSIFKLSTSLNKKESIAISNISDIILNNDLINGVDGRYISTNGRIKHPTALYTFSGYIELNRLFGCVISGLSQSVNEKSAAYGIGFYDADFREKGVCDFGKNGVYEIEITKEFLAQNSFKYVALSGRVNKGGIRLALSRKTISYFDIINNDTLINTITGRYISKNGEVKTETKIYTCSEFIDVESVRGCIVRNLYQSITSSVYGLGFYDDKFKAIAHYDYNGKDGLFLVSLSDDLLAQYPSCKYILISGRDKNITISRKANLLVDVMMAKHTGAVDIGQMRFVSTVKNIELPTIHTSEVTRKIASQYELMNAPSMPIKKFNKSELHKIVIKGKKCSVVSYSDEYIYFNNEDNYAIYRIRYEDLILPTDGSPISELNNKFERFVLPYPLPNQSVNGDIIELFETKDGGVIVEIRNGEINETGKRDGNIYKLTITDKRENEEFIDLAVAAEWKFKLYLDARMFVGWNVNQVDNVLLISPYGFGRRGLVYLSQDYGNTFEIIFNMGIESEGNGTHPTPASIGMPPTFWNVPEGANGNLHVHGAVYDKYWDRIWVVTGDAASYQNSYTAIWYSDDLGQSWKYMSLYDGLPFSGWRGAIQMMNIIPMRNCVLFPTDGYGNGFFRYNRQDKDELPTIEHCYTFGDNINKLEGVFQSVSEENGIFYSCFSPNSGGSVKAYTPYGGIVATTDGFHFEKVYIDAYADGTKENCKLGWHCDSKVKNGILYISTLGDDELIVVKR